MFVAHALSRHASLSPLKFMQGSGGIGTPGSMTFDMIGREPIEPMVAGFLDANAPPPVEQQTEGGD